MSLNERETELYELAVDHLNNKDFFDYWDWDGLIYDEALTDDELEWLDNNFVAKVVLVRKDSHD
jgi:hypothetical protein